MLTDALVRRAVSGASIAASLSGFAYYALVPSAQPVDAGRGGAVGVAIALGFMLLNRAHGMRLFQTLRAHSDLEQRIAALAGQDPAAVKRAPSLETLDEDIATLARALAIDSKAQNSLNVLLAVATAVGTLVWGFGDAVAPYLIRR